MQASAAGTPARMNRNLRRDGVSRRRRGAPYGALKDAARYDVCFI